MVKIKFTSIERKIVVLLAAVLALRMLGLFMVLPIFATEAEYYQHNSPKLIGFAFGIYGFMQATLQIPFGILSDKIGRKPVILLGLMLFMLGSLCVANVSTIYGLILGRALQGAGAVGCVIMAAIADYTRKEVRSKAMAMVGMSIGITFMAAMVLGPWLSHTFGFKFIFLFTAFCCLLALLLIQLWLTKVTIASPDKSVASFTSQLRALAFNFELVNVNFGVFVIHASLSAMFLLIPKALMVAGFLDHNIAWIYLATLSTAGCVAFMALMSAEKRRKLEQLQLMASAGILLAELMFVLFASTPMGLIMALWLFFTGFCILEASLPSLVAAHAAVSVRGAAMGIYSTMQFLGIFVGSCVGGLLLEHFTSSHVFIFCMLMMLVWLVSNLLRQFKFNCSFKSYR